MPSVEPNPRVTFKIRHEGDGFLVVEKPSRVVTQPGVGHEHDTLLNGLFALHGNELQRLGASRGFGLLHRLDKETSGLVIVALRIDAYDHLRAQFEARSLRKYYWAVVRGTPKREQGVMRLSIEEVTKRASRYTSTKTSRISKVGKPALTAWRVLASSVSASLVEARPVTGRLHQVRVHMEAMGCPILGDDTYAPKAVAAASPRLALHAHRLVFAAPSGAVVDVSSTWPRDLRGVLTRCELPRPDGHGEVDGASADGGHQLGGDAVGQEHA